MQLPYNPATAVPSIYPREIKTYVQHGNLYLNVYSSLTHNCQKLETIQMSLKRWMVKKYMVYSHHGLLLGNKKEGPTATCSDPDEFPDDYAECKSQPQKVIYYMILFMLLNHKPVCQIPRPCPAVIPEGARHPSKLAINQRCTRLSLLVGHRDGDGGRGSPLPQVLGLARGWSGWGLWSPVGHSPQPAPWGHQLTQWPRTG